MSRIYKNKYLSTLFDAIAFILVLIIFSILLLIVRIAIIFFKIKELTYDKIKKIPKDS